MAVAVPVEVENVGRHRDDQIDGKSVETTSPTCRRADKQARTRDVSLVRTDDDTIPRDPVNSVERRRREFLRIVHITRSPFRA